MVQLVLTKTPLKLLVKQQIIMYKVILFMILKKQDAQTVSHLRFGPKPIYSTYLIHKANFIACHQFNFIEKYDILKNIKQGGTFLLNSPFDKDKVWNILT